MTQVREHLETHGVPFEPIAHQQAYTSIAEARALGIDASEVLKTVAVRVGGGYALMAVPATCRLDLHRVQAAVGDRGVRLATEEEVLEHETVVFAAGSQTESVQIRTADLLQHEQVTTVPLIKHAEEDDKDWLP
jgi:prolyl-tRNA editing enzyme YbaK/EbsC (Cys-tRNA(Pro) deacylase)